MKNKSTEAVEVNHGRVIETIYYRGARVLKRNFAAYENNAVVRCVDHMQRNNYQATVAEVFNNRTGELHAVVKASHTAGQPSIAIIFKSAVIGRLPFDPV